MCIPETGTLPPPMEPLTVRERRLLERCIADAEALAEARRAGNPARELVRRGYDAGTPSDSWYVEQTLRRVARWLITGMQQGTG